MSRKSQQCLWLAILICACALIPCIVLISRPKLPVYQGWNLYEWLDELQQAEKRIGVLMSAPWCSDTMAQELQHSPDPRHKELLAAQTAIRSMGTNALPFIIADLRARDTFKDQILAWLSQHAPFLKLNPKLPADKCLRGLRLVRVLGHEARPCMPELVILITNNIVDVSTVAHALLAIGPGSLPVFTNLVASFRSSQKAELIRAFRWTVEHKHINPEETGIVLPCMARVFHSTDSTNNDARKAAAWTIGFIRQKPEFSIPLLIEGATDPEKDFRSFCHVALNAFGEVADPYVGKFLAAFSNAEPEIRLDICQEFSSPGVLSGGLVIPVLIRGVQDNDPNVRVSACGSLGQLGPRATNAIPALEHACSDPIPAVRIVAINALNRIRL